MRHKFFTDRLKNTPAFNLICIFKMTSGVLFIFLIIFGCTKSQIKDSLKKSSGANQYATVTIFPTHPEGKEFAECIQEKLKDDLQQLKFIPGDDFRDNLFPWFEPRTIPTDAKGLSALLRKPMVLKRIESLGVEILVYVHGETVQGELGGPGFCGGGYGSAGCLGYVSSKRETHIATTVWDLKEAVSLGDTDIHIKGEVRVPMLLIPLPIPVFTESTACSETARRISSCLTDKALRMDKPQEKWDSDYENQ